MVWVPSAGLHWSELRHSAHCQLNPPGLFCWLFCDHVLLPPLILSDYGKHKTNSNAPSFFFFVCENDGHCGVQRTDWIWKCVIYLWRLTLVWVMTRVKTEWDRELLSFIPVAAVARCLFPSSSQAWNNTWESTKAWTSFINFLKGSKQTGKISYQEHKQARKMEGKCKNMKGGQQETSKER